MTPALLALLRARLVILLCKQLAVFPFFASPQEVADDKDSTRDCPGAFFKISDEITELVGESVADQGDKNDPRAAAQRIVDKEALPIHSQGARDGSGNCPQAEDVSRPKDRRGAVPMYQIFRYSHIVCHLQLLLEEAREARTKPAPNQKPAVIAGDGRGHANRNNDPKGKMMVFGGQKAREHQNGFTGKRQTRIFPNQSYDERQVSPMIEGILNGICEPMHFLD